MGNIFGNGSSDGNKIPVVSDVDNVIVPKWANQYKSKVKVFFDIEINKINIGRIEMTLADEVVPVTVENFRCLCTG